MLYGLGLPKLHSSLLSWVPSFPGLFLVTSFASYSQLAQFNASASRSPEISLQEETNVLIVLGAVIDTVAATTDAWFGNAEQWKINPTGNSGGLSVLGFARRDTARNASIV